MQDAEVDERALTTPNGWDSKPLPKRNGPRGMLPSTWIGRSVRLGYAGVDGKGIETTGTLLDWFTCGPAFNLAGTRTLIAWDRLVRIEPAAA